MKKILFLLLSYYSTAISSDISPPSKIHDFSIEDSCIPIRDVIALVKASQPSAPITIHNSAFAQNMTEVTTVIKQQMAVLTQNVQKALHKANNHAHTILTQLTKHPYIVIGSSLLSVYAYLLYTSLRMHYFVHNNLHWHAWKKELSIEQLCEIPMANLSQSLIHTIQSLYINPQNPTDSITPLAKFVNAIDSETNKLKRYIVISTWVKRLKISLLLPKHTSLHELAQEKLRRLCFIKHIFTETIASQNSVSVP